MLTDDGFHVWCLQNRIPAETKAYIERIRSSQPVRKVRSRASNVSGRYPSRKMGRTIQFESHHVELYGIYEMEYDDDVLEYYDQPIRIQLQHRARSGRKTTQWHTPDFFVIRQSSAGFEEWKPVTALDTLKVTMPERYQHEPSGGWRCPPGESAAQAHGLFYRIRTNAQVHPLVIQNLKFLQDFWIHVYEVLPEQEAQVLTLVTAAPGISVRQLQDAYDSLPVDVLWALLTDHRLVTDLSAASLMQWDQVRLFRPQDEAEKARERAESLPAPIPLFTRLSFDGRLWEAEKQGDQVVLRPEVGAAFTLETSHLQQLLDTGAAQLVREDAPSQLSEEARTVLLGAGPTALAAATGRLSTILAYLRGESVSVTKRSVQNWRSRYREAERAYGCGSLGLLDQSVRRGNRAPRIDEASKQLLETFLRTHYAAPQAKRRSAVYALYRDECTKQHLSPVSQATFYRECALALLKVKAICIDEAQHLLQADAAQKPSIQLDWLKSLTNQSQLLYILVGNFSLYDFCHLNGQLARRVREEQFCRYHLDQQADAVEFTSALKVLLEQVTLQVNIPEMLTHWKWFGEWSIGCIGILSDWVVETASTLCRAGETVLTLEALAKHALKPAQRLKLETEARAGEFKIEEAKKESERELQRLLGKPSTVPMSALPRLPLGTSAPTAPLSSPSHASSRIERASYRDPLGEQIVTTTRTTCTYLGIIKVTRLQFHEAGTTCVECPTWGARRTLKSPKDRPHFPSHPRRLTPPPKGERRWVEQEEIWKVVED